MSVLLAIDLPTVVGAVAVAFLAGAGVAWFLAAARDLHDGPPESGKRPAGVPAPAAPRPEPPSDDVAASTDRPAEVMRRHARRILDGLVEGVIGVDEQGRTVFVNPAAGDLLGWGPRDLMGVNLHHLVMHSDPEGHEVAWEASPLRQAIDKNETVDLPATVLWSKARKAVRVACTVSPLREGARTTGAVIVFRDLSEQRRAEQRFRQLLDAAPDAMVIVDAEGRIVHANHRVRDVLGHDPSALVGQQVETLVPEALRDRHVHHRDTYHKDPRPRPMGMDLDLHARKADGTLIPVEISLAPIETPEGTLVTAAIRDVSERLRVRDQLRHHEIHLREAQRLAHLGSWEFDMASGAVHWSDELYRMYGLETGAPVDLENLMAFVHPDDQDLMQAIVDEAGKDAKPFRFLHRVVRPDGEVRVLEGRGQVVVEDGEPIRMHGTALDVTTRPEGKAILAGTEAPRRLPAD